MSQQVLVARAGGVVALLLIAACGGSGGGTTSSTLSSTTAPTSTTQPAPTTLAPTTTTTATTALDCPSYGEAIRGIAQSLLYQTFDGAAALQNQHGEDLASSLLAVSTRVGSLPDEVAGLGEPPPGFEEGTGLMLDAMDQLQQGYAAAVEPARAGDQPALDAAIAMVDAGFLRLLDANAALATAQECSPGQ